MTLESDSNPTFAPNNSARLQRTKIAPDYKLTGTFGVDEIGTGLGLQIEQSSDKNISQPRQDPTLFLNWRRVTETGELGLATKYEEASTRASELNQSGLVVRDGTRKTQSLSGNWRASISERSSLVANADYSGVAYDSGTLTSYSNTTLSLNYTYAWKERIEPFLRLVASHYKPDGTPVTAPVVAPVVASDNTTLTGGVQFKVSDNLDWTAQAGTSRISGATSSNRWQGSFVLRYTGERHAATFEAGRSISASGEGGFVESDLVKGNWSYAIDARARAGIDASRRDSKSVLPNTMNQLGVWASQELSPFWNARLSYQYTQRLQSGLAAASAGLLGLSLSYTHPDF
jgi:hypothetical protein